MAVWLACVCLADEVLKKQKPDKAGLLSCRQLSELPGATDGWS